MPTIAGKTHNSVYIHLNIDMTEKERDNHMLHIVMTQYALKIGLKKFKEQAESAVTKSITQLHTL